MKNSPTQHWTRRRLLQTSLLATGATCTTLTRAALAPLPPQNRVIFVYTPQGAPYETWQPDDCGAGFTLRKASAPLEPVKQHCVFFRNLFVENAGHGITEKVLGGGFTEGRETTLDVRLGEVLSAGAETPNIMLAAGANYSEFLSKKDNERLPYLREAAKAYLIYFGDRYADPDVSTPFDRILLDGISRTRSTFDQEVDMQIALSVLALQRRTTNVISLMWGDHQAEFPLPPNTVSDFKGDFHQAVAAFPTAELFTLFRAYLSAKLAHLIELLTVLGDETGRPLLDSTLVVHVSDQGDGRSHTGDNAPYLIAGAKNLFRNGAVLDVARATQYDLMDTIGRAYGLTDTKYGTRLIDDLRI